ncbi:MAG TPA: glycosyltransferase family 2 protein [Polyangia bacterium]|jgi:glycosyltransferase involved in cell wall biosynthesis|nr:glycosyltransferase family 2 protein [Polyangia bacterium]
MYRGLTVAVAIPAYRAESTIGKVIATLPSLVDHIVVVDDASPDGLAKQLEAIDDPRLTVVRHGRNGGVGAAMKTAFERCLELNVDVVVKMDADGQMDPAALPALLDALIDTGCDYAKGNRFLDGAALAAMPRLRFLGNLALTFLTKMASGYWHIFDPQNGYVACRSTILRRLNLAAIANDYFFENDMLIHLNILQGRVVDVPMPARYGDERSSMRIGIILRRFPARLLGGFWRRILHRYVLRDFSPVALFLFMGTPLLLGGALFGAWAWYESWKSGVVSSTGRVMLSALPIVLGFQLILQAILLDINSSPR